MSAARYYQRSPRYIFRPGDKSLMRFAGMETKGQSTHAHIHDLSETGLSFVVDGTEAPFENELLKIEFGIPGHKQMAWFATVVRVEVRSDWSEAEGEKPYTLIALRFRQLPAHYRQLIQQSVSGRVDHNEVPLADQRDPVALAKFAGLTVLLLASSYWLCLPLTAWVDLFLN